ncbi:YesK family protein [Virgibacillus sp. Bac330]|uniref:YesK family protein n=1 Tax=Virgibacillus sp. Bac330 TaxID=2419841 RepID=UPI0013CF3C8F|nr:YesK family protein [Virgibacillus sp. Bac330]
MDGLGVFFIVGVVSMIVFYFTSRTLLNKNYKKITYLTPVIVVTLASFIFFALTYLFSEDGWEIMGNYFLAIVIVVGALIGTFLPFIHSKYR